VAPRRGRHPQPGSPDLRLSSGRPSRWAKSSPASSRGITMIWRGVFRLAGVERSLSAEGAPSYAAARLGWVGGAHELWSPSCSLYPGWRRRADRPGCPRRVAFLDEHAAPSGPTRRCLAGRRAADSTGGRRARRVGGACVPDETAGGSEGGRSGQGAEEKLPRQENAQRQEAAINSLIIKTCNLDSVVRESFPLMPVDSGQASHRQRAAPPAPCFMASRASDG
jgi:hypothetical protein